MAKKVPDLSPASSSSSENEESSSDDEQQPPNQSPQSETSEASSSSSEESYDETADEPKPKKPSLQEPLEIDSSDDDSDADDSPPDSASPLKPVFSKSVSRSPKPKSPISRTEIDRVSKLVTQQPSKVNKRAEAEIEGEKIDKVSNNKKSKVSDGEKREMEEIPDFWSLYPGLCASIQSEESGYLTLRTGVSNEYVKQKIIGMGEEKARKLEDKWKVVSVMRDQLYARRTHALNNLAKVTMNSLKYF